MSRTTAGRYPSHALALVALIAGLGQALLLAACSMKTLAHPFGMAARPDAPRAASRLSPMDDARARMAAQPNEPYWPFHLAELELARDSLTRAEAVLGTALTRDPGYAPALAMLSKLDSDARRHAEGAQLLEKARADTTHFPHGLPPELAVALALHEDALGRRDLAAQALLGVPANRLGSAGVYVALRGDAPDSASAAAAGLVREHPQSAVNQNNYGITRLRAGDPEAASNAFLLAIELDASLPGPYYNLAILEKYYRLDDAAAERWFRKYRERATDDPDGLAQGFEKSAPKVAEKKD